MVNEVDRIGSRADEIMARYHFDRDTGGRARARRRKEAEVVRRIGRIAMADALIVVAALAIGFVVPLGMFGALAVMVALIAATLFFAILPGAPEPTPQKLSGTPLKALPRQTEAWLDTQRRMLPAPAITLADQIGMRLETLAPQLVELGEDEPAARELRKLMSEQLPELVNGFARVPEPLRRVERNGRTPEQQLVDGLSVIEREIGEMTEHLAQGDLDRLATRERYLQIRYQDEDGGAG